MFGRLSLDEPTQPQSEQKPGTLNSLKYVAFSYEDTYQDSECFSIEIQKIHSNPDLTEGDIMPRRRRKKGRKPTLPPSVPSQCSNNTTTPSENGSSAGSKEIPLEKIEVEDFTSAHNDAVGQAPAKREESDDTMVSIEIEDEKEESANKDKEMDETDEMRPRCIRITIKDDLDQIIFEKNMVISKENIKIRPFLTLIDEF